MIVAVTGSTGLIGTALVRPRKLAGISCGESSAGPRQHAEQDIRWDPAEGTIDAVELSGVDAIVHLAGANVAGRRLDELVQGPDSRQSSPRHAPVVQNIAGMMKSRPCWSTRVNGRLPGDRGDEPVDESSPPGRGFLADVCQQWESETEAARDAGVEPRRQPAIWRGTQPRRRSAGSNADTVQVGCWRAIGSGRQYISWIALDDAVRVIQFALHAAALAGPVNAVAPGGHGHQPPIHRITRPGNRSANGLAHAGLRRAFGLR